MSPRLTLVPSVVGVLGLGLALAGCGGGSGDSGFAKPGSTVTVTKTPSSPSAPSSSAAPSSSPPPATVTVTSTPNTTSSPSGSDSDSDAVPLCGTPDLRLSIAAAPGGGTAGAAHDVITFHNVAGHPCSLDGYAGVSFVSGGHQVGAAADRVDAGDRQRVTLIPNAHATEAVTIADPTAYGSRCDATAYDAVLVYPPHNRQSVSLDRRGTGCAADGVHLLEIGPVQPVS